MLQRHMFTQEQVWYSPFCHYQKVVSILNISLCFDVCRTEEYGMYYYPYIFITLFGKIHAEQRTIEAYLIRCFRILSLNTDTLFLDYICCLIQGVLKCILNWFIIMYLYIINVHCTGALIVLFMCILCVCG